MTFRSFATVFRVSAIALVGFQCKTGDVPSEPTKPTGSSTAATARPEEADAGVNPCIAKRKQARLAADTASSEVAKILGRPDATEPNDIRAVGACQRPDDDTRGRLVKAFEELAQKALPGATMSNVAVGCIDPEGVYVHGGYTNAKTVDGVSITTIARTSSATSTALTVVATATSRPKAISRVRAMEVADIDGDGKRDVIVAEEGNAATNGLAPVKISVITAKNQRIKWTGEAFFESDSVNAVPRDGGGHVIVRARQNTYAGEEPQVRVLNLVKDKLVQDDELARGIEKRLVAPVASLRRAMSFECVDQ